MNVLIAGCGYVGTELGRSLVAEGWAVWALRRHVEGLPLEFTPLARDLSEPDLKLEVTAPITHVVCCTSADGFNEEAYRTAYVEGPRRLIHALAQEGHHPEKFLFTSSTSVYGDAGGDWVDETTSPTPSGFSGRILLEGEQVVLSSPYTSSVVRFGGIYGPDRTHTIERVRTGQAVCVEGRIDYMNHLHRDDCAGILQFLLETSDLKPIYIGVDQEPADRSSVYCWIADKLGTAPPPTSFEEPPVYEKRGGNKRCSSRLLVESGYRFKYPTYREGYAALIDRAAY